MGGGGRDGHRHCCISPKPPVDGGRWHCCAVVGGIFLAATAFQHNKA